MVPLLGASVTTNFGGADVVPLQGAHGTLHSNGIQKKELFAGDTLFSTLITQKSVFAIWGLCWYNSISGISIYSSIPLPIASANLQAMSPLDMHNASLLKHTLPLYSFVSNAFLNAVLIHQDVYILGMTKKPFTLLSESLHLRRDATGAVAATSVWDSAVLVPKMLRPYR